MKYLCLELYKLKRRKVFLTFVLILGVELLFVFSNYGNNENFLGMISDPNAPAWEDLIVGPATMNGLFFPFWQRLLPAAFAIWNTGEIHGSCWSATMKTARQFGSASLP